MAPPTVHIETLRPLPRAGGDIVRVALDAAGERVAFAEVGGRAPGIYVCAAAALDDAVQVADGHGFTPVDLRWSPTGEHLAYRIAPTSLRPDEVAWAGVKARRELGRIEGMGMAWLPSGKALLVSDPEASQLLKIEVATGKSVALTDQRFEPSPSFFPAIVPSPDGSRVAFTGRDEGDDSSHVWWLLRQGKELAVEHVTRVPGANVHVQPFWSPKGRTLGLWLVHTGKRRTGLVLLRGLEGDGELLYRHDALDDAGGPAWAPGGRHIAFLRRVDTAGFALALLRAGDGTLDLLTEPGRLEGRLRFSTGYRLLVDGEGAAHRIQIQGAG